MTISHMRIACWKPKAKNTHSENAILKKNFSIAKVVAKTQLDAKLYVL